MSITLTNESKNALTITNEASAGQAGMTWNDATMTWEKASGSWDEPGIIFANESKKP